MEVSALGYNRTLRADAAIVAGRAPVAAVLGRIHRTVGGAFEFEVSGDAECSDIIEASDDLKNWIPVRSVVSPTGRLQFTDPDSENLQMRFYRA